MSEANGTVIDDDRPSIECPRCGRRSWHPEDVRQRYCGACHQFHPGRAGTPEWLERQLAKR